MPEGCRAHPIGGDAFPAVDLRLAPADRTRLQPRGVDPGYTRPPRLAVVIRRELPVGQVELCTSTQVQGVPGERTTGFEPATLTLAR